MGCFKEGSDVVVEMREKTGNGLGVEQETSMSVQNGKEATDDFQLEVNKMRNSLNAITMKNFMFEEDVFVQVEDGDLVQRKKELEPPSEPAPLPFKRNLSKRRLQYNRLKSEQVNQDEVLEALVVASNVESEEKPKVRVHFAEEDAQKSKSMKMLLEPSRDSDEVASINQFPWHKKNEYRNVTPFLSNSINIKAVSTENLQEKVKEHVAFRPIETSRSTEDINNNILKPVPILSSSKSYQELPTNGSFKDTEIYQTKSIDDLLLNNIDGVRKPESKIHKLIRIRSVSNTSLNRTNSREDQIYENYSYERIPEDQFNVDKTKKAPQPLPRSTNIDENNNQRSSLNRKLVYVLNKDSNEFVLEDDGISEDGNFDEVYEDVCTRNNIDQDRDSKLFNTMLLDDFKSQEDSK